MTRVQQSGVTAVVLALMAMSAPSYGQQNFTLNLSSQSNVDMATIRGFDPKSITGPSDPFPDTSNPFPAGAPGVCTSSQYGCGVPSGSSGEQVLQNCDTGGSLQPPFSVSSCTPLTLSRVNELAGAFQHLEHGMLSMPSSQTSECSAPEFGPADPSNRCTQIEYSFSQNVMEKGQVFEMTFSLRSLTDASGNPIFSQGSYTQTLKEDGVTSSCGGTFTFDGNLADTNNDARPDGLSLHGPAQQC